MLADLAVEPDPWPSGAADELRKAKEIGSDSIATCYSSEGATE
ncbi:MAG: hypothetical protein ACLRUZ_09255 [Faecalimonas sp.]